MPLDPGSTFASAYNLGSLSGTPNITRSDFVGAGDLNDYFRFTLPFSSSFSLSLTGLGANADLELYNSSGARIGNSASPGTSPEAISSLLGSGAYYVRVFSPTGANTNYNLRFQGSGGLEDPGNFPSDAMDIGTFSSRSQTYNYRVQSFGDVDDFFRVNLAETRILNLSLTGLTADADLFLYDGLGNLLGNSSNFFNNPEFINRQLGAGTYYIRVNLFSTGTQTDYFLQVEDLPPDFAGNTFASARSIQLGSSASSFNDFVGAIDPNDFYTFSLSGSRNVNLALTGLSADADLQLFNSSGTLIGQSILSGNADESLNQLLAAGTYFIRVYPFQGNTEYTLRASALFPALASDLLPLERSVGVLSTTPQTFTGTIGNLNTSDLFRFVLDAPRNFNATLTGLSSDLDIRLIRDSNNNGIVDPGEDLVVSERGNNFDEAINIAGLDAGAYFLQVYQFTGNSDYLLRLSATPPSPTTQPSNLLPTEVNVGTLFGTPSVYNGVIGTANAVDTYRFALGSTINFNASLTGLGTDIDIRLIRDGNNNGIIDPGEEVARSQAASNADEAINLASLTAGTYFLQVYQFSGDFSGYTLRLSATPNATPSNLLPTEVNVGALSSTPVNYTGAIGSGDTIDTYRFSLNTAGTLNAFLNGLSSDLDLRLIQDLNNNGLVDAGEEIGRSEQFNFDPEQIVRSLVAGTYFLQVYQFSGSSPYNLSLSATPNDLAGNTLAAARLIAPGIVPDIYSDYVGVGDGNDFYRFTLGASTYFNLALVGLSADVDVELLDANGLRINFSERSATQDESINQLLTAGTYFIRVYPFSGSSNYSLRVSTLPLINPDPVSPLLPIEANVGVVGSTPLTLTGNISNLNTVDVYRFNLAATSNLTASLGGLTSDLDLRLIRDANNNGIVDAGDQLAISAAGGVQTEQLNVANLLGGTYFIQVYQFNGSSNYTLNLFANSGTVNLDPGNTLPTAEVQTSPVFTRTQQVSLSDRDDFYTFTLNQSGIFTANLSGLSGDADIRLVRDSNNNGLIDQGEVVAWQWERGTGSESIRRFLTAGTYFLQVNSYNNQTANYFLSTGFAPASSEPLPFSIAINFITGSEVLSDAMRAAVLSAARFWENVIPFSSFNGAHTLTIDVGGTPQNWSNNGGVLASAGPRSTALDANGRVMPTTGVSFINNNPAAVASLTSSIEFFTRVMIHEFGHVLGLGTFWRGGFGNSFVNTTTGTYSANTYAGWAYGELLGTFAQTAVPVTTGVGPGSDFAHWREQLFRNELMTHAANRDGMPLSQLTIAALRDLGWNVNYGSAEPFVLPAAALVESATIATSDHAPSGVFAVCGCAAHLNAATQLPTIGMTSLQKLVGVG